MISSLQRLEREPESGHWIVMTGFSLELCAGAGGQALGLERAGFEHAGVVEIDPHACGTLRLNRPKWTVHEEDLNHFDARLYKGVDLVAGGFPCPRSKSTRLNSSHPRLSRMPSSA